MVEVATGAEMDGALDSAAPAVLLSSAMSLPTSSTPVADSNSALVAHDNGNDDDVDLVRVRLLASGPWRLGALGKIYLLRNGVAHDLDGKRWGTWGLDGGRSPVSEGFRPVVTIKLGSVVGKLTLNCWKLKGNLLSTAGS